VGLVLRAKVKNGGTDVAEKSFVLLSVVLGSALASAQQSQSAAGSIVGGSRPDRDTPCVGDALTCQAIVVPNHSDSGKTKRGTEQARWEHDYGPNQSESSMDGDAH
jgi:hypothetical protein